MRVVDRVRQPIIVLVGIADVAQPVPIDIRLIVVRHRGQLSKLFTTLSASVSWLLGIFRLSLRSREGVTVHTIIALAGYVLIVHLRKRKIVVLRAVALETHGGGWSLHAYPSLPFRSITVGPPERAVTFSARQRASPLARRRG